MSSAVITVRRMADRPPIRLADGSLWIDPPNYVDGSGCSMLGNRLHPDTLSPESVAAMQRFGCVELLELYGVLN